MLANAAPANLALSLPKIVVERVEVPEFLSRNSTLVFTEHAYDADEEIYGEGEPADYAYQVVRGAVRSYKMLSDGRRQISAFHLPGNVFGLTSGAEHRMSAEAVVGTTVRIVKRRALDAASRTDPSLACALWTAAAEDLRHAEDHMVLLGRKSALEKLATFLLEMDRRLAKSGFVVLPMPRRDIADYIGVTIETVSRTVTQLTDEGALELAGARNIKLVDRRMLADLSA
jgi:CRP/FNR family nitrogen fixation transcriptional regulator